MPIQTDLSVAPYYDDFSQSNDYYKILFKPGVAVQVRELNQLQTILQNQIEQFGDNIFTRGTIINGCNFHYYPTYPYVKVNDLQVDLLGTVVNNYVGLYANNSANLTAYIMSVSSGYQSQAPDLNTLFVRYINSGNNGQQTSFNAQDSLTIFDSNNSIFQTNVPVGGTGAGFSNTDVVTFMSAVTVTNTASVTAGQTLNDPVSLANAVVTEVNATAIPGSLVLKLRPYANALTNVNQTSTSWTFNPGNTVLINNVTSTQLVSIIGSGATGTPVTDASGKIVNIIMLTQGNGYNIPPYATIKTSNSTATVASLSLTAQNYLCQLTVANTASAPIGSGYAFGVSEGVIYQKGYFLYVAPQTVVVSKYSNTPDGVVVGFNTNEAIINSNIDTNLLDNSAGTFNAQAPGADRLLLAPALTVLSSAASQSNTEFFTITAFSQGQPYLQNQQTSYSIIGDEMAKRTQDTAGDFVIDPFVVSTITANTVSAEANTFQITIDPGYAYISGKRVQTFTNYVLSVPQGNTTTVSNTSIALNYGNYITINELGGVFDYTVGDLVTFYDTAKQYLSNNAHWSISNTAPPVGNAIGRARIRHKSLMPGGTPGTNTATYNLYLYDVDMNPGYNFRNARSVYYSATNGTAYTGIADIKTTIDPTLNTPIATVVNTNSSGMVFYHGATATKNANTITYIYKDIRSTNTAGIITVTTNGNEYHPYSNGGTLSATQEYDISVIPLANVQASANYLGTFGVTASSNVVTASVSPLTVLTSGDYIKLYSNSLGEIKRITSVINSTAFQVDSNTLNTNATSNAVFYHPANTHYSIHNRTDRFANLDASGQILTIVLNKANSASYFSSNVNVRVECNILKVAPTPLVKVSNRYTWVKLNLANVQQAASFTGTLASGNLWITSISSNTGIVAGETLTANITGITVGTTVSSVNSTVVIMSAAATGSGSATVNAYTSNTTGPWNLGIPDIHRLKAVFLDLSANVVAATANTGTDVTNQFYIDHNQNVDYYNHGYLNLNPGSTVALTSSKGLLVAFDNYTNVSAGFFAGRVSYPVDDTLSFATLNATLTGGKVNTHEIPELVGKDGVYRDLIDHVDFRPRVPNTATVSTTVTGATINPAVLNANTRFGNSASLTTKIGFPVPASTYSSTLENYLGRVDRVVIDKNGVISSIQGVSGANNLVAPPAPVDTMTITLLYVPPYPSVPSQLSSNYTLILDKGIANETLTTFRVQQHTVIVPTLTVSQQKQYQPVGYTMKDIANLEARIAALEFYVTLTSLEQNVKDLTIPSSVSPTLNRFKYGFFADNFNDLSFTDTTSPENTTSIINHEVVPQIFAINIPHKVNPSNTATVANTDGKITTLPYTQKLLTGSIVATNNVIATSNTVVANSTTNTTPVIYTGTSTATPTHPIIQTGVTYYSRDQMLGGH